MNATGRAPAAQRIVEADGGAQRSDPAVREVIHGSYRIVYELRAGAAEVLTVFRASRLFPFIGP